MIKICGITNREDALAAAEAGADALGFNFYAKSPRYIDPDKAARIAEAVAGVLKVGVFVNESPERMLAILREVTLDIVQLHGDEESAPVGVRVWKAFRVGADFSAAALDAFPAEAYLLDTPSASYGGTGKTFDWARARSGRHKIVLAGGLGPDNVAAAIAAARPWGVDAASRLESAPGKKDHALVTEFVRKAKEAWAKL